MIEKARPPVFEPAHHLGDWEPDDNVTPETDPGNRRAEPVVLFSVEECDTFHLDYDRG